MGKSKRQQELDHIAYLRQVEEAARIRNEQREADANEPRDESTRRQATREVGTDEAGNIDWGPTDEELLAMVDDNNTPPFDNSPGTMNNGNDQDVEMAQARSGPGGGNSMVSKETPVILATPSYGLQETHTTILPWSGWLTVAGLTKTTPAQLKIRMNTPYDMLDVTTQALPTDGALPTTKGFYTSPLNGTGRYDNSAFCAYPEEFTDNTTQATERPSWREYWSKLYDYYTVLGCEYEIILHNPMVLYTTEQQNMAQFNASNVLTANGIGHPNGYSRLNTDIVCAVQYDTYSDTATSTGNVMPLTRYSEVRTYKNIKWYPVQGGSKTVIRGTYRPGQAKRNIVNDGDVKTWTATSTTLPNLKEILTLNFWNDPFYVGQGPATFGTSAGPTASGTGRGGCANMEINLKYIVQFKDLKQQARYPNTITTDQDITQILNETISASGSALQSWTTAST